MLAPSCRYSLSKRNSSAFIRFWLIVLWYTLFLSKGGKTRNGRTYWCDSRLIWVWMLEQMGSLTLLAWQKNFEQEIIPIMWYNSIQAVLENSNTSLHFILFVCCQSLQKLSTNFSRKLAYDSHVLLWNLWIAFKPEE